ncbi:MAG TPA: TetR family transcriptional regulator [Acidimicrobiales bacterium]|nr:TetR family transcriptional regulator [Acidimicrobiales bacterium]
MTSTASTERGRRTRRRIVDAALQVVAERGANAASLDEVGARAGTSKGQLYHYFDDRNDLLRAVAEATNEAVLGAQAGLLADLGTAAGMRAWADALVALNESRHGAGGCPIASLVTQVGERDEAARAVLAGGFDRWELAIRSGLVAQEKAGELSPDVDTAWLAANVLASLQGGLVLAQARRDPGSLRASLDGALALVDSHRPRRPGRSSMTKSRGSPGQGWC